MPVTVSIYNHTARRFADGSNSSSDSYRLILCTSSTFDATNTSLSEVTKTEVADGNGYTANGQTLANLTVNTVATNGAKIDADDVVWTASGGSISASSALLFNDTDASDPPVAHIDFGATRTAPSGIQFVVEWDQNGIFTFTTV